MILSEINKDVGTWDAENTTELDDRAYAAYCKVMDMFWAGFDNKTLSTPITQIQFMMLAGRDLKCFYDIAIKENRYLKLKSLKQKIK